MCACICVCAGITIESHCQQRRFTLVILTEKWVSDRFLSVRANRGVGGGGVVGVVVVGGGRD